MTEQTRAATHVRARAMRRRSHSRTRWVGTAARCRDGSRHVTAQSAGIRGRAAGQVRPRTRPVNRNGNGPTGMMSLARIMAGVQSEAGISDMHADSVSHPDSSRTLPQESMYWWKTEAAASQTACRMRFEWRSPTASGGGGLFEKSAEWTWRVS